MKKIIFSIFLLFPLAIFATPAESIGVDINNITCPNGADYDICGSINAKLHNQFVVAIKQKNAVSAIGFWNKMLQSTDGSDVLNTTPENLLFEPLFGNYAPEGIRVLPYRILAKKAYKGGIITLGTNNAQDWVLNEYYISYIKYKKDGMLYVYNESLIPLNSKQYNTYSKLYPISSKYNSFDKDITLSFMKGKFNNKNVNAVYQKFIKSIR